MDQPDVGDTHVRIAGEIHAVICKVGVLMDELRAIGDECHELGLINTESDIDSSLGSLQYATQECLGHRTVPPLG